MSRGRRIYGNVRRKPSGRYEARYTGPDGVRRTVGTYPTKGEADSALALVLADVHQGTYRAPELGAVMFGDYARRWLSRQHRLQPRTRALYERLLERWVLAELEVSDAWSVRPATVCLARFEVRNITPALVEEWHAAVCEQARASATARAERAARRSDNTEIRAWAESAGLPVKRAGRLSPALVEAWQRAGRPRLADEPAIGPETGATQAAQAYRLLHTIGTQVVRERMLPANPCQIDKAGTVRAAERRPASVHDLDRIAAGMPERYRAAVHVAAWSGLRASELFALARKHVDLQRGTVRVERALIEVSGRPLSFGPPKSDAGRRTVHLPRGALAALAEHMRTYTAPGAGALVFCTSNGTPLTSGNRTRFFARAREAAGLPELRWHDLRHTGATFAAQSGATLPELQNRLGHSTARAALIYQHATTDADARLADRLSEMEQATNVLPLAAQSAAS